MNLKISKKECYKQDIKIPKGYRIIEDWECIKEMRTSKRLNKLAKDSYIWVKTKKGVSALDSYYSDYRLVVGGYGLYGGRIGYAFGVFVREAK